MCAIVSKLGRRMDAGMATKVFSVQPHGHIDS